MLLLAMQIPKLGRVAYFGKALNRNRRQHVLNYSISRETAVGTARSGGSCRCFWRSGQRGALVIRKYSVPTTGDVEWPSNPCANGPTQAPGGSYFRFSAWNQELNHVITFPSPVLDHHDDGQHHP